jgi:2-polyprenyl-6-methoxyphenol hydroxylase-like FAD-dependent oxidoreductase
MDVIIVGGGIGGLTLALSLHRAGIGCRVYEQAPELRPLGVGINILPHASRELAGLGLESELTRVSVLTREAVFFNRFGQLIYREPLGRYAGYDDPQYSIHRSELHKVLLAAAQERLGADRIFTGW